MLIEKPDKYIHSDEFHRQIKRVYNKKLDWAVNKKSENMAHVLYEPTHFNNNYEDSRRGKGKNFAKWIFSEQIGTEENLFHSGMELVIDSYLEPFAAIGLHYHHNDEEIYYILEGSISMTTVNSDNQESTQDLFPGDAHAVKQNQGHYGTSGENGARFLAIAFKMSKE